MTMFIVAFAAYTVLVIGVGLWSSRRAADSEVEFFLAGRRLGPWVAALSASASSESGWVTLGLVGWAFASGVSAFWILPAVLLGFAFNWFVLAGPLRQQSGDLGAVTLPDYLAKRFPTSGSTIRVLGVIIILAAMTLYVAAQFAAAGKAFHAAFDGLDYLWGVFIGAGMVLFYVVLGGFRAACWTDLLQGLLMVAVLVFFPAWILLSGDGIAGIAQGLAAAGDEAGLLDFWPGLSGAALIGFLLGSGALGVGFGYVGQPHVLVRYMAMRDRRDAIAGGIISIVWALLVITGAITVGLMARSFAEQGATWAVPMLGAGPGGTMDGEYALIAAAQALLPPVFGGLAMAAILAAIASTADSQLVVGASAVASDLLTRVFGLERVGGSPWVHRVCVLLVGISAVLLVMDEQIQIYTYVLTYGWAILGAGFGPQILLALFWRRASGWGCVAGLATGFLVAIIWKQAYAGSIEVYNLPLAFVAAGCMNVLVSLAMPMKQQELPTT
jgi:sodium/proline symporter